MQTGSAEALARFTVQRCVTPSIVNVIVAVLVPSNVICVRTGDDGSPTNSTVDVSVGIVPAVGRGAQAVATTGPGGRRAAPRR